MAPRLNKRQLREQAELEELEKARAAVAGPEEEAAVAREEVEEQNDDTSDDTEAQNNSSGKTGFAALNLGEELEEEEDEENEPIQQEASSTAPKKSKNKKKKKKKAPAATPESMNERDDSTTGSLAESTMATGATTDIQSTPSKKKAAKGKSTGTPTPAANDEMDEIDRALAELAAKGGPSLESIEAQQQTAQNDKRYTVIREALSFDPKMLDGDAELRKFFGSKIINHTQAAPRSQHHARFANNPHHATSIKRTSSYLANPEPGWLPATGVLKLERYHGPEAANDPSGEWWTFVHTPEYRIAQMSFLEVLQQADGNRLFSILQSQPYHIDTHLQLAEMLSQQGDLTGSSSHLSRALYAMSAPLPPSFTSGGFRLSYNRIENRAFFIAVARNVAIQTKRGTWRTATEWAKIALGTSGGTDPMGMLCFLDFLAPKSGQNEWFLELYDTLPKTYPNQDEMQVEYYPGLAYARALCLRQIDSKSPKTTEALKSAILRFPMVVPLLLSTLGGNVPPSLISNPRAQVDGSYTTQPSYLTSLLSSLYAHRSAPLWKDPSLLSWLTQTATSAAADLSDSSNPDVRFGEIAHQAKGRWQVGAAPAGVIRAIFLSDVPSLRPYLPPSATSGEAMYSYDPLPPRGPLVTFYDDTYFEVLHSTSVGKRFRASNQSRNVGGRGGTNAGMARGLAAQLAALLGIGEGGGAIDMNDDLRRELMQELEVLQGAGEVGAGGRGRAMPGGFGAEEDDEDED